MHKHLAVLMLVFLFSAGMLSERSLAASGIVQYQYGDAFEAALFAAEGDEVALANMPSLIVGRSSATKDHDAQMGAYFDYRTIQTGIQYTQQTREAFPFGKIVSIYFYGDKLYFLDNQKNCIHVADENGNILNTIGVAGNAPGELMNPAAFTVVNDEIHVADFGNKRIQIFSLEGISKETISLSSMPEYAEYVSIGKVEDGYLLAVRTHEKQPTVYFCRIDGSISEISEKTMGLIATNENDCFYIEFGQYEKYSGGFRFSTGENAVFKWNGESLVKQKTAYPYGFWIYPSAYCIDNSWYAFSGSFASVDRFDMDWNYVETILTLQENMEEQGFIGVSFAMSNNGKIYVFAPNFQKLYIFTPSK
ncbi:MAG: 6-bladed beta-propeller [Firmicutes bacterium]|nr:6-bladed beta-propeller [Bacillota bacterium]